MESATVEEGEANEHPISDDMVAIFNGHYPEKDMASMISNDCVADIDHPFSSNQISNGDKSQDFVDESPCSSSLESAESGLNEVFNYDKTNGTEKLLQAINVAQLQKDNNMSQAHLEEESKQTKPAGEYQQQGGKHDLNFAEEIGNLRKQLQQTIMAQSASEELIAELRATVSSAERRAEGASMELLEAQSKMDEEVKTRDKKYAELDVKFGKLQKRAKQRIQEVQKEKEDVEVQLATTSEKAAQALSKCTSLQHDLERVRAQAGDALRSLDAERQQLRSTTTKQKEVIEDLQQKLEALEEEHKEAHRVASEKEQVVNELTDKMMEMEKNQGILIADQISKHQKLVADLEAQLGDAVQERTKSAESVASLQTELAKKESYIAELDAASSGEAIRLMAALDATRADLARMEQEHGKEQNIWAATLEATKLRLEEAEKTYLQQEIFAAKEKSQLESELQGVRQALSLAQTELLASKEQASLLGKEFSAYKVRAHSLLQKKEAELCAAKDAEQLASQEAALKEAQNLAASAVADRDQVVKALKEATLVHDSQLAARTGALLDAQQKIREMAANLEASKARMLIEEEAWQNRLDDVNQRWQERYNALMEKNASKITAEQEMALLKEKFTQLEGEYSTFQEMANTMLESKDQEIARLLEEVREMQKTISDAPKASREDSIKLGRDFEESHLSVGEQQILMLARQQAQREEELSQCQRHIQALQDEIVELEHENRLHTQQEAALKEELRNLERSRKREGVDMTYLKNVIVKLLETGEVEALLPVVAMLLQFSRDELKKCQEVYNVVPDAPATHAPTTLFSRFLFSKAGK
ncbi:hypothetical protein GOP47_0028707 [Adiantum capillus-veneris]|nr:hypothetical protein GOP47_0028172 [Adiantum capillus-veneris]KAI5056889.1 hypothetical protein GOP47_0028707 [Adiantum capillus-veneris]